MLRLLYADIDAAYAMLPPAAIAIDTPYYALLIAAIDSAAMLAMAICRHAFDTPGAAAIITPCR